jgi:hypothetical protein
MGKAQRNNPTAQLAKQGLLPAKKPKICKREDRRMIEAIVQARLYAAITNSKQGNY